MKLASSPYYDGYSPLAIHARCLFNGEERKSVVFADEEAGEIVEYATDESGRFIVEGDSVKTQRLKGDVCIVFPDRPDVRALLGA